MTPHPIDKCKLCGHVKELCDSHYLPKRLYAYLRAERMRNPNPVMAVNRELKQMSDQYRGYVFCDDCEDLLNKKGEKWVLANIPHYYDGPFPLQDALAPLKPTLITADINVYNVLGLARFDVEKLVHFGIGIFWRSSVHQWKTSTGQDAPPVDLATHQESMRKFVLGTGPFPNDVVLMVDMWPYKNVLQVLYPVIESHLLETNRYWFYIPGLFFSLYFGPNIPDAFRSFSAINGFVVLNRQTADSIINHTTEGAKSQGFGPKIQEMLAQINKIRSKPPS